MAEQAKPRVNPTTHDRPNAVELARAGASRQLGWLWSRESLLRLALSLVLATGLWLWVTGKQNPTVVDFSQPLPVTAANVGVFFTVTNNLGYAHVRYRSDSPNLYVSPATFQVSVNLLDRAPGTYRHVPLEVTADPGVQVVSVTPRTVAVVVQRLITKHVPIVPHYLVRNPPSGYVAATPVFDPSTVTISGPQSVVSVVTQATVDIDLAGARSSILALQKPTPADTQGAPVTAESHVSISPAVVQVRVPVKAIASYKSLPLLVALTGHPRTGYGVAGVEVSPAEITAIGSPKILGSLKSLSTAPVSLTGLGRGTIHRRVKIVLPHGVSASTHYATVTVTLNTVAASASTRVGIRPLNVAPGLVARVKPGDALVTLLGPSSLLNRAAGRLLGYVNLAGYGAGVYQLAPQIRAPSRFNVENVYPSTVTVVIQPAS